MSKNAITAALLLSCSLLASGCVTEPITRAPFAPTATSTSTALTSLPPPAARAVVAVYRFPDETGQFKPSETVTTYSRAVTQGAVSVLVKALKDAGNGTWFQVVERNGLPNLITERRIITETRQQYTGPDGRPLGPIPPLLYAGVMLDGGVIGYDSNTRTGGLGARYLGIGANVEYREDTVTVYLRAISVQTGEVLKNVVAQKSIISYGLAANVFKFIAFKDLLEIEGGIAANEPGLIALKQAIEKAVYDLIMEGSTATPGTAPIWTFADAEAGAKLQLAFQERRDAAAATEALEQECAAMKNCGPDKAKKDPAASRPVAEARRATDHVANPPLTEPAQLRL